MRPAGKRQKKPWRVLIVDDDYGMRAMYAFLLQQLDPKILFVTTASSSEAIAQFRNKKWDLLITDLIRGGIDEGTELMRWSKENHPRTKILLSTAASVTGEKQQNFGADFYLQKPYQIEEFKEIISRIRTHITIHRRFPRRSWKRSLSSPAPFGKRSRHPRS